MWKTLKRLKSINPKNSIIFANSACRVEQAEVVKLLSLYVWQAKVAPAFLLVLGIVLKSEINPK